MDLLPRGGSNSLITSISRNIHGLPFNKETIHFNYIQTMYELVSRIDLQETRLSCEKLSIFNCGVITHGEREK